MDWPPGGPWDQITVPKTAVGLPRDLEGRLDPSKMEWEGSAWPPHEQQSNSQGSLRVQPISSCLHPQLATALGLRIPNAPSLHGPPLGCDCMASSTLQDGCSAGRHGSCPPACALDALVRACPGHWWQGQHSLLTSYPSLCLQSASPRPCLESPLELRCPLPCRGR